MPRGYALERAEAARLRALGYEVHIGTPTRTSYKVRGRTVHRNRGQDVWGFVDVLAIRRDGIVMVQCGPDSRVAAKRNDVELHAGSMPCCPECGGQVTRAQVLTPTRRYELDLEKRTWKEIGDE